jgi:two-component system, chemotaxis family, protein-glutamate methylesterase/glutaminase
MSDKRLVEFTCPDCRGPMSKSTGGGPPAYRCLVGHAYSPRLLLQAHYDAEERQLWSAALALEEAATIAAEVGADLPDLAPTLSQAADAKRRQAKAVEAVIEQLRPFPLDGDAEKDRR